MATTLDLAAPGMVCLRWALAQMISKTLSTEVLQLVGGGVPTEGQSLCVVAVLTEDEKSTEFSGILPHETGGVDLQRYICLIPGVI